VSGIIQDSRGFIWISTQDGMNRFDGREFKSYSVSKLAQNPTLTGNVKILFENQPGKFLICVGNGQLYQFDVLFPTLKCIETFKNRMITDVFCPDKNTRVLVGLDTVFITDPDFNIQRYFAPPIKTKNVSWKVRELGPDQWLLSSWRDHFIMNSKTGGTTRLNVEIDPVALTNSGFDLLYVDSKNKWIYFSSFFLGVVKFDTLGKVVHRWNQGELGNVSSRIIPDPKNDSLLWIGGGGGLAIFNMYTHKRQYLQQNTDVFTSVEGKIVTDMYFDHSGKLWAATTQGLYVQTHYPSVRTWKIAITEAEPAQNMIKAKDNNMYIAKYYGGIQRIDLISGKEQAFLPEAMKESWFIFESGDSLVQGGKGTDLICYNKKTGRVTRNKSLRPYFDKSELIVSGFCHSDGSLWFSANVGGGLVRIQDGKIHSFKKSDGSINHSYLVQHAEDAQGDLWFSNNKSPSLLHWIKKENRFEETDFAIEFKKAGLFQSVIHCISIDQTGNLWLGFDGSGLLNYRPSEKKWTLYDKRNGLPSNFIHGVIFDGKGRLWTSSMNGLACMNPVSGRVSVFNQNNGFPSYNFENSCSYFDNSTQQLWIAANDQLLAFNPETVLAYTQSKPKVFIDEMAANNRLLDISKNNRQELEATENNIRIQFASLCGSNTGDIVYSYSLDGNDGAWVDLGNADQVNFANMKHGDYEFILRARIIGSDEWFYLSNPLRFHIAIPWYKTTWFALICLFLILSFVVFQTNAYYSAKAQKQKSLLEKQLAVQSERERISFDMHDDLGSGLTKISYLTQAATQRLGQSQELDKIKNTSLELVNNMSELIWAMKPENDNLEEILGYLKRYAVEYLTTANVQVSLNLPDLVEDRLVAGEKRRHLFLVFKEALHNAVKHAQATRVEIRLTLKQNLHLEIEDNGLGFDVSKHNPLSGNGLRTMRMRSQKLNGSMDIQSEPGNGTRIVFDIPL
jgi:signal transduction histidine kinase